MGGHCSHPLPCGCSCSILACFAFLHMCQHLFVLQIDFVNACNMCGALARIHDLFTYLTIPFFGKCPHFLAIQKMVLIQKSTARFLAVIWSQLKWKSFCHSKCSNRNRLEQHCGYWFCTNMVVMFSFDRQYASSIVNTHTFTLRWTSCKTLVQWRIEQAVIVIASHWVVI